MDCRARRGPSVVGSGGGQRFRSRTCAGRSAGKLVGAALLRETHGETTVQRRLDEQVRAFTRSIARSAVRTWKPVDRARVSQFFQYSAIVGSKGALMFEALRKLLGYERFFAALRDYYSANLLEVADMDDLRGAFIAGAPVEQRARQSYFDRWLSSKRGDEDIGPPDPKLAAELGLPARQNQREAATFHRLCQSGEFLWQQMSEFLSIADFRYNCRFTNNERQP